ncbi:UDP-N-acetylmuramyl-tripeptide synthetase [Patescibacteria group bacterium]|nr:UDP-N-acetylmuramyl-tripeptide synthetase [Patescibacteria group bacterium]MBU1663217.1 UDP-N-acetylmuramyl-tripeptide synthetase [Patescibacteria group bacterium]MBU1934380.1 UDP-N-acetylmuramyl-tripeptide synthetase [Patescibacteria group bacterium]MBU2008082.1 UDP-N-acetylmuramyl-tripeptide synthetase [Patescibacteria group bacterium]MBU2233903.1 UDP-N-acetylmuramyl-tripeptide synthetase [Patescibacteria group bacterium]
MDRLLHIIKKYIPVKLFKALQPAYHFLLSLIASVWYGWPSNKLIVIGVTGTTGKTTSVYLIAKMLTSAGYKTGFTSTAIFNDGQTEWLNNKKMTMAGRFFTQKMLKKMVKNNCKYAIVETTSQGVEQFRHKFINYDILIFTGLYPEHIEAHGGFENYKQAKGKLFSHLQQCKTKYANDKKQVVKAENGFKKIQANRVKKTIIANLDDKYVDFFLSFWAEEKFIYTKKNENSPTSEVKLTNDKTQVVKYGDVKSNKTGVSFKVKDNTTINLKQLGEYNAANAMTAVCLGLSQKINLEKIKIGLEKIKSIPGRMELITSSKLFSSKAGAGGWTIIVDYAFEPEALKKIYSTILKLEHNKIIHVLGSAGGGRDIARRPKIGGLAGKKADIVIVTNEDPYDDDPNMIIAQVAVGAVNAGKKENENLFKIEDRREAIKKALSLAETGDIVLITGKGCEQAICIAAGKKIKWDDRDVAREELKKLELKSEKYMAKIKEN